MHKNCNWSRISVPARRRKRMKLSSKNFLYTGIIAGVLVLLCLGYFIWMFPSLSVEHIIETNQDAVKEIHECYLRDGSYKNSSVHNNNTITFDFPLTKEPIQVTCEVMHATIQPKTEKIKEFLQKKREELSEIIETEEDREKLFSEEKKEKYELWKEEFVEIFQQDVKMPFEVSIEMLDSDMKYKEGTKKLTCKEDGTIYAMFGAYDEKNEYTIYSGISYKNQHVILTCMTTFTPQMTEIVPVIFQSLPMILAVIVLFALVVSYTYSKGIVDPITRLVHHTKAIESMDTLKDATMVVKGKDEIAQLTSTLNHLYQELEKQQENLRQKNAQLEAKNKSQEVFLRASSHQLKTPIAAALLLVDGMIHEIGKYKDTKTYLPEVKKQLLFMKKLVEDILYLRHCEEDMHKDLVDVNALMTRLLSQYEVPIQEGNYEVIVEDTKKCNITTDENLLIKILDNLLGNAIAHSENGAKVYIQIHENTLSIHNICEPIKEEIISSIFEPFVSGSGKGRGLGLYIANYYAKLLGFTVQVRNEADGVTAQIFF